MKILFIVLGLSLTTVFTLRAEEITQPDDEQSVSIVVPDPIIIDLSEKEESKQVQEAAIDPKTEPEIPCEEAPCQ